MKKLIQTVLNDTLKSPNGKYSRKSLTMFVSFGMAVLVGGYVVHIRPQDGIQVFYGFLALGGGITGMSIYDKYKNGGQNKEIDA